MNKEISRQEEVTALRVILSWGSHKLSLQFPDQKTVTVAQALMSVKSKKPEVFKSWCDKQGHMRQSLQVFVNNSHVRYKDGLDTVLKEGDRLHVIAMVTGG